MEMEMLILEKNVMVQLTVRHVVVIVDLFEVDESVFQTAAHERYTAR